jgi:hypothetical protein
MKQNKTQLKNTQHNKYKYTPYQDPHPLQNPHTHTPTPTPTPTHTHTQTLQNKLK